MKMVLDTKARGGPMHFEAPAPWVPLERVAVPGDEPRRSPPRGLDAALLGAVLDHVKFGVILLGADGALHFVNRAARLALAGSAPLRLEQNELDATSVADRPRFARAVEAAAAGRWTFLRMGESAAVMTMALLPLPHGDRPYVLLLLGPRHEGDALVMQLYGNACRLTPAETRVLCALAEGLSPHQIAQRHAVNVSTVRTQIGSTRAKTGTRSITELTRSLLGLPAVLPTALMSS